MSEEMSDEDWLRERLMESEELLRFAAQRFTTSLQELTRERDEARGEARHLKSLLLDAADWGAKWKKRYGELYQQVHGPGKSRRKKKKGLTSPDGVL